MIAAGIVLQTGWMGEHGERHLDALNVVPHPAGFLGKHRSSCEYSLEGTTIPTPVQQNYRRRNQEHTPHRHEHRAATHEAETSQSGAVECQEPDGYDRESTA